MKELSICVEAPERLEEHATDGQLYHGRHNQSGFPDIEFASIPRNIHK
jgi:hypothetical protein